MSDSKKLDTFEHRVRRENNSFLCGGGESQCFPCKKWFVTAKLKDKKKCPHCGKKLMNYG